MLILGYKDKNEELWLKTNCISTTEAHCHSKALEHVDIRKDTQAGLGLGRA